MRTRALWLMVALLGVFLGSVPGQAQPGVNELTNGGFEEGPAMPVDTWAPGTWNVYGTHTVEVVSDLTGAAVPEAPVEGKYCLHVTVPAAGANFWDVGLQNLTHTFQQGKKYTLSLFLKCNSGTLTVNLKPELGQDPYTGYGETQVTMTDTWTEFSTTTAVFASDVTPGTLTIHIAFAPGDFWVDGVRWYEGDYVPPAFKKVVTADEPNPDDTATDVPRDKVLNWKAGPYAAAHNVYLGTSFADVNSADLSQAASPGQTDTSFQPASPLDYDQTYYWRVDEVNAAPDSTVFRGDVWSFTVEPYAYPITGITATASSQDKSTTGPANTVNGSGLTNDLHSTVTDTMWLSGLTDPGPVWIQYAFDKVYKLQELWVWNHDTEVEPVLGYGFKDVTIETSTDGTTWTLLKDVQFAQATALAGYAHNTTVDLDGVMAQYVRLTANSNWSPLGWKQYGLSEVRFYHIPVDARAPQPANKARDVSLDSDLDWRPGRDVTSHNVFLGTDKTTVADGTVASETVTEHGLSPDRLDFGTTYYWKVDEVGATTYPGSVWSFTTQEYQPVDDFESYTDQEGEEIFAAWIDGFTDGMSNSVVGYFTASGGTFGETSIVHGGNQSMPLEYNNVNTPYYSEATRTLETTQDWTVNGADSLALWYRGYPAGFVDKGGNAFAVSSAGADIWGNADEFRYVYKQLSGNGSITARVDSLVRTDAWAKAGVMIRESLEANSKHASTVVTPDNSCSFQRRPTTGAASTSDNWTGTAVSAPYWVRITRTSNTFKAETSPDGKTWTALGTDQDITMAPTAYIGLAVTSHSSGVYTTAELSNVSTSGNVTGTWQDLSIGVAQQGNTPAPLYVTVEDRTGKKVTVVNPDPAAVNATAWTEWQIAFADLAGVNLAAVQKLSIGVGDKASPKAGGAGMLYIDDIGFGKPAVRDLTNLAVNGGFETGDMMPWNAWGGGGATVTTAVVQDCTGAAVPAGPIEGQYCLNVKVSGPSTNFWDCAFNVTPPTFAQGTKYTLSAFFKTRSGTGKVNMKPEHAADPWEGYGEQQVTITDQWVEYHVTTPVFTADVSPTSLTFHIGFQAQEFWVDNVKFYEGDYVPSN